MHILASMIPSSTAITQRMNKKTHLLFAVTTHGVCAHQQDSDSFSPISLVSYFLFSPSFVQYKLSGVYRKKLLLRTSMISVIRTSDKMTAK